MEDKTLYELANVPFDFKFDGKTYSIRKANLEKVILYQKKIKELAESKDETPELSIAAYCIYLCLKDADANITIENVKEKCPGNIDVLELLEVLGFMSPLQIELRKKMSKAMEKNLTSESSLPESQS